uniref:Uncharacterized protein n=1 Tax=Anguilla anguilla TaxID=7936 RepID=A0A0E9VJ89_ANGAN
MGLCCTDNWFYCCTGTCFLIDLQRTPITAQTPAA